jgi:host factor-I protein
MPELDLSIPSTRYIQKLIRDQSAVRLKTHGGDVFAGQVRWQDQECLCLATSAGEVVFWRSGISYLQPNGASAP